MAGDRQLKPLKLPAIDPSNLDKKKGIAVYPAEFRPFVVGRVRQTVGDPLGLKNFGVNLTTLEPDSWSSIRHWHTRQDEFIFVVKGELTLVTDEGEQTLTPGMAAGFPAGSKNGHHLVNRSSEPATYLEVGDRTAGDEAFYPDADLEFRNRRVFVHRDGTPYVVS